MTSARLRLVALVVALAGAYVVLWVLRPVSPAELRAAVASLGWVAPVAYVPLAAVLGTLLVPGAALATVAGLLFGAQVGAVVVLAAAVSGAVLSLLVSRAVGRAGVAEMRSGRLRTFEELLARRGLWAVVVLRLMPAVPDGPVSHAAGLVRVRVRDMALGTLIGSAPRAVAYVLLGDALGSRDLAQGAIGGVLLVLTGAVGLLAGARALRRARRGSRRPTPRAAAGPPKPGAPRA